MNKQLKARIFEVFGTQSDFAEFLDVQESLVSQIIRGRRRLSVENQKRWADVLSCKPKDIFEEVGLE